MIGSISNFLDPIIIVQSLALAGVTAAAATKQYGELMATRCLYYFCRHLLQALSLLPLCHPFLRQEQKKSNRIDS